MIKIVCSAIKVGSFIIPCIRHFDGMCNRLIKSCLDKKYFKHFIDNGKEQIGFLDNNGKFYSREEAAIIYNSYSEKKVGQFLNSEDLY